MQLWIRAGFVSVSIVVGVAVGCGGNVVVDLSTGAGGNGGAGGQGGTTYDGVFTTGTSPTTSSVTNTSSSSSTSSVTSSSSISSSSISSSSSSSSSVATVSTGPIQCDNTGNCGDTQSGCIGCAVMGPCAGSYEACGTSTACIDYATCVSNCGGNDPACQQQCAQKSPGGEQLYTDLILCVLCDVCSNDCPGAGCP
jgi:hypothetical protein